MAGRPKGQPKTGGREKGTTNGDTAKLRGIILGALDQVGGMEYLAAQAIEQPAAFLTLIGKVLPKDMTITGDITHKITRIELVPLEHAPGIYTEKTDTRV